MPRRRPGGKGQGVPGPFLALFAVGLCAVGIGGFWLGRTTAKPSVPRDPLAGLRGRPVKMLLDEAAGRWSRGDLDSCRPIWEEVLRLEPGNFDANQFLGTYWLDFAKPSNPKLAVVYYEAALKTKESPALSAAYRRALQSGGESGAGS